MLQPKPKDSHTPSTEPLCRGSANDALFSCQPVSAQRRALQVAFKGYRNILRGDAGARARRRKQGDLFLACVVFFLESALAYICLGERKRRWWFGWLRWLTYGQFAMSRSRMARHCGRWMERMESMNIRSVQMHLLFIVNKALLLPVVIACAFQHRPFLAISPTHQETVRSNHAPGAACLRCGENAAWVEALENGQSDLVRQIVKRRLVFLFSAHLCCKPSARCAF